MLIVPSPEKISRKCQARPGVYGASSAPIQRQAGHHRSRVASFRHRRWAEDRFMVWLLQRTYSKDPLMLRIVLARPLFPRVLHFDVQVTRQGTECNLRVLV